MWTYLKHYFISRKLFWYITVSLSTTSKKKGVIGKEFRKKSYLTKMINCLLAIVHKVVSPTKYPHYQRRNALFVGWFVQISHNSKAIIIIYLFHTPHNSKILSDKLAHKTIVSLGIRNYAIFIFNIQHLVQSLTHHKCSIYLYVYK